MAKKKDTNLDDVIEEVSEETAEEVAEEKVEELSEEIAEEPLINVDTDDDKLPIDPETGIDPEELKEELEGLKDLFQGEIDKMMDDNPDADWKEIVKAAKEEKMLARLGQSRRICECCGDRFANEDCPYCRECLEGMKHYPFKWWSILFAVIMIALLFLSFSFFAISFPVYRQTVDAQSLVKEGKLQSALELYDNINAEISVNDKNFGYKYLRNQVEIYETIGIDAYEDLSEFISLRYPGTDINKSYNEYVREVQKNIDDYTKLYDVFDSAMVDASTPDGTYDYDAFVESYAGYTQGKDYNAALVAYYKYYASLVCNESSEVQKANIGEIRAGDETMHSLYLPLYAELAVNEGDYEAVLDYTYQMETYNCEDVYVWLYRALAYRMQGNITAAANACNEGLAISSEDPLINYQMAVVSLLQGQNEAAFKYAETAYAYANTENAFFSSASLYALCASLCNDTDTYNAILEDLVTMGAQTGVEYELSADVEKVINGTKTVEDIFTVGKGDFEW